jgi:glycerol dehydrogenase
MIYGAMFPGRYIQGKGALNALGEEIKRFTNTAFIICAPSAAKRVLPLFEESLKQTIDYQYEQFNGECSDKEIDRLTLAAKKYNPGIIVGLGGGKTLDTVKVVAYNLKIPVIIVPTIASTDAPCSMKVVIYNDAGIRIRVLNLPKNPDLVLVDSQVIANAPVRFLISGMGDALSTYFEAKSCNETTSDNTFGKKGSQVSLAIAESCYKILLNDGIKAKQACENNTVNAELEHIIEANTLLSGIGFESGGLASTHSICNGLSELNQTHNYYHGEKVAFGTLTSLFLTEKLQHVIDEVYSFCESVGLPTTLADIGLTECTVEDLNKAANAACLRSSFINNEPVKITNELIVSSILAADEFGRSREFIRNHNQC